MLAHVDTLCLDKTGTITEGKMRVVATRPLGNGPVPVEEWMGSFLHYSDDNNATFQGHGRLFPAEYPLCARKEGPVFVSA